MREGVIYRATAGFYSVYSPAQAGAAALHVECRGRGLFRKDGRNPLVGDRVQVRLNEDGSGTVEEILPRKNELLRPPLANLDYMVLVLSVDDPAPNLLVVDKYLAVLEHEGIPPMIVITKSDLAAPETLADLYRGVGFPVFVTEQGTGRDIDVLTQALQGKFSAFTGNTGVGKSSLLNALQPTLDLPVGDTSKKLGRGKNTTRHVETHQIPGGGFVADTPGFTALELAAVSAITKDTLADSFRDFRPYATSCRFIDCSHTVEAGCAVLQAVKDGEIAPSRHESYSQIYAEIKDLADWQRR